MTRGSIQEYREAMRERYLRAGKKDKGRILDEFVNVAGYPLIREFRFKRLISRVLS